MLIIAVLSKLDRRPGSRINTMASSWEAKDV